MAWRYCCDHRHELEGGRQAAEAQDQSPELVLNELLCTSWSGETRCIASAGDIDAFGHRVVHSSDRFQDPVLITKDVYSVLAGLSQFAPLHIQSGLEGMKIVANLLRDMPQFGIFDTDCHRQMPSVAQT